MTLNITNIDDFEWQSVRTVEGDVLSASDNIDANDVEGMFGVDKVREAFAMRRSTLPPPARLDDILTFLPGIPAEEYEHRAKLRSYRNAASAMIAKTECRDARCLAWMATDAITSLIYAPADCDELAELAKFTKRLMITAMQADQLRDRGLLP